MNDGDQNRLLTIGWMDAHFGAMMVDAVTPRRPERQVTTPKMSGICLGTSLLEYLAYSTNVGTHHERPPRTNEANVKPNVIHMNVRLKGRGRDGKIGELLINSPVSSSWTISLLLKQINDVADET